LNIRYQADADLNQAIVTGLLRRESTIDFQTAFAAGLEGVKDSDLLAIAAQQRRVLVSHDRKTMPSEFAESLLPIRVPESLLFLESDFLKSWSRGEAMRSHIQYAVGLPVDGKQEQCDLWVGQGRRVHQ
jgi:hypothetical protein